MAPAIDPRATRSDSAGTPSGAGSAAVIAGPFLVDGHVHCHDRVAPADLLESARLNLAAAGHSLGLDTPVTGWLLFVEQQETDAFARLAEGGVELPAGWRIEPTAEDAALLAEAPGGERLILVAGRQVATCDGLEVLALGTTAKFVDGNDFPSTLRAVRATHALAVIPWGFGKWTGRRGRLVADAVAASRPGDLFLGDNGGRAALGPRPRLFADAEARGIVVLSGSDPLPLWAAAARVARYGFVLEGRVERARPVTGLLHLLRGLRRSPETFGELNGLAPFLAEQAAMQWLKRTHRPSPAAHDGGAAAERP